MQSQYPEDEHVVLTDYERRQFHLIEQALADEDPRQPHDHRSTTGFLHHKLLLPAVATVCVFLELLGFLLGSAALIVVSTACIVGAVLLYRRRLRTAKDPDGHGGPD